MTVLESILLGLLQGVTEFLPVSSSGHLLLAQKLLGLGNVPLLFDVFLHLATLLVVILFFWKKLWSLLQAFFRVITRRSASKDDVSYIVAVICTTLVTGVIGVFVEKALPAFSLKFVCVGFIFTSVLLVLSSVLEKKNNAVAVPNWKQGLFIGFAQGIGTLPGVSRSGSTISGALFCGVTRETAGEFSFIASIPAIFGAFLLELKDLGEVGSQIGAMPVLAGCIAAFASGVAALTVLMKIVKSGKLSYFAFYLVPAGILGLLFLH